MSLPGLRPLHSVLLSLVILIVVGTGCEGDYRPRAVGKEGVVTVVMDSSLWTGPVGTAFQETVTPWVNTLPVSERYFEIQHLELSSEEVYDRIQKLKNVVIVAPLRDSTNEANFLRRRFSDKAVQAILNGQNVVVSKPNLWRRSQRVFYVTASTPEALVETLRKQGSEIKNSIKEITLQRMKREMYDRERRYAMEDSLLKRHGFAVNLQTDFLVAVDTTSASDGFVWLRRLLAQTRREFFVYYVEDMSPDQITPEWIYSTRDSLTREHFRGNVTGFARIDYRRPLQTERISFQNRYGFRSRGLWYMVTPVEERKFRPVGGGGPFINYTFYDQETDRVYMLDGSVYAPEFDKMKFIRQMEVMAKTFRTSEEVQSQRR